jgi:hypothetical protein
LHVDVEIFDDVEDLLVALILFLVSLEWDDILTYFLCKLPAGELEEGHVEWLLFEFLQDNAGVFFNTLASSLYESWWLKVWVGWDPGNGGDVAGLYGTIAVGSMFQHAVVADVFFVYFHLLQEGEFLILYKNYSVLWIFSEVLV